MEKNVELKNKIDPVVYNEFRDMVGLNGEKTDSDYHSAVLIPVKRK